MTDADLDNIVHRLSMKKRREVVARLMERNDAQCFTTQQYADEWHRWVDKGQPSIVGPVLAEIHLRSLGCVREVGPGVWTAEACGCLGRSED